MAIMKVTAQMPKTVTATDTMITLLFTAPALALEVGLRDSFSVQPQGLPEAAVAVQL
jgi:hypothetical protein